MVAGSYPLLCYGDFKSDFRKMNEYEWQAVLETHKMLAIAFEGSHTLDVHEHLFRFANKKNRLKHRQGHPHFHQPYRKWAAPPKKSHGTSCTVMNY